MPIVFEGEVQGGDGTRVARAVQPDAPGVPRSAHGVDRHRAQHDRSEHAHGRPAEAVAVARRELQAGRRSCSRRTRSSQEKAQLLAHQNDEVERKNQEVEQARQALEEKAKQLALTSKYKSRIPGEHVARAAHAAQQPAHPVRPALEEPRRQPDRRADRVRQDDPLLGQRPADADQRHSRPVEDRIGHGRGRRRRAAVRRPAPLRRTHVPPRRRSRRRSSSPSSSIRTCRGRCYTDAKRLQQIIKNLLSNAFKFTHAGPVSL